MDKARMKKIYIEKRPSRGLHMWYTTAQTDKTDAHIETTIESADKYCEIISKTYKENFLIEYKVYIVKHHILNK